MTTTTRVIVPEANVFIHTPALVAMVSMAKLIASRTNKAKPRSGPFMASKTTKMEASRSQQTITATKLSQPSQVRADRLAYWLENYDPEASLELVEGFQAGFRVHFQGKIKETVSENLPSALALPHIVSSTIHSLLKE